MTDGAGVEWLCGGADGVWVLPIPGQEFVDAFGRVAGNNGDIIRGNNGDIIRNKLGNNGDIIWNKLGSIGEP